ncbi:hypothetical protein [Nonlabens sp.]
MSFSLNSYDMKLKKDRVVIASDVIRDGIGIEVYKNNKLVL